MVKSLKDTLAWQKFKHKSKESIGTYLELMYKQKSSLNKIQNLEERKLEACAKAKLDPKDADVVSIMEMKHEEVNEVIQQYLVSQNSNRFHLLCSSQQLFWNMQRVLNKPLDITMDEDELEKKMKSRTAMEKEAETLMTRIDNLYSEVFATDDVVENAQNNVRKMISLEQRLREPKAS